MLSDLALINRRRILGAIHNCDVLPLYVISGEQTRRIHFTYFGWWQTQCHTTVPCLPKEDWFLPVKVEIEYFPRENAVVRRRWETFFIFPFVNWKTAIYLHIWAASIASPASSYTCMMQSSLKSPLSIWINAMHFLGLHSAAWEKIYLCVLVSDPCLRHKRHFSLFPCMPIPLDVTSAILL